MAIVPNYIVFRNKNAQFFHENLEGGGGGRCFTKLSKETCSNLTYLCLGNYETVMLVKIHVHEIQR